MLRDSRILEISSAQAATLVSSSAPTERVFLVRAMRDPDQAFTARLDGDTLELVTWSGDDCFHVPDAAVRWPVVVWGSAAIAHVSMESPYTCP